MALLSALEINIPLFAIKEKRKKKTVKTNRGVNKKI